MIRIILNETTGKIELKQFISCDKQLADEIKLLIKEYSKIHNKDERKLIERIQNDKIIKAEYIFNSENSSVLNLYL